MTVPKKIFWAKTLLWCLLPLPFIRWWVLGFMNDLTANPAEFLIRSSGTWTLVTLWITLSVTPVRHLTQQTWIIALRRLIGLWTFFYAFCHFTLWMWLNHGFTLATMLDDVVQHPFIAFGVGAFAVLTILAMTSPRLMLRLLRKAWKPIHRCIYLAAVAALIHYFLHLQGKNQLQEPLIYGCILIVLLLLRLPYFRKMLHK